MNSTDFFLQWNNKYCDFDNTSGSQCVDIVKQYFQDVLGLPPFKGNAIDYWTSGVPGFKSIPNSLFSWPKPGDLVVWNYGQFGHIAIVNWSRTFDMGVFEQNNPVGSPCHYSDRNYKNVLGWLQPMTKSIPVAFLGLKSAPRQDFIAQMSRFTSGQFSLVVNDYDVPPCDFSLDAAMKLLDTVKPKEKYVFIETVPGVAFDKASYYPARNQAFTLLMPNQATTIYLHEQLHLFRKYVNFNKIKPFIEDVEMYPTTWDDAANPDNPGWAFKQQYQQLLPYKANL